MIIATDGFLLNSATLKYLLFENDKLLLSSMGAKLFEIELKQETFENLKSKLMEEQEEFYSIDNGIINFNLISCVNKKDDEIEILFVDSLEKTFELNWETFTESYTDYWDLY